MNNGILLKCAIVCTLLLTLFPIIAMGNFTAKVTAISTGNGKVYVHENVPNNNFAPASTDYKDQSTGGNGSNSREAGVDVYLYAQGNDGYELSGWSETSDGDVYPYSSVSPYIRKFNTGTGLFGGESSYTIYAKFQPCVYIISYNPDGGVVSGGDSQSYTIESTETLRTASKFGCVFQGWKVRANSGSWTKDPVNSIPSGTSLTGKYGDVTLDAQWVDLPELTISVSNLQNGESAIFNVSKGGSVLYTVAVGTSPVTIKYLEAGEYTVTPTSWSWAYTMSDTQQSQTLNNSDKKTFSFTATPKNDVKKHDEKSL